MNPAGAASAAPAFSCTPRPAEPSGGSAPRALRQPRSYATNATLPSFALMLVTTGTFPLSPLESSRTGTSISRSWRSSCWSRADSGRDQHRSPSVTPGLEDRDPPHSAPASGGAHRCRTARRNGFGTPTSGRHRGPEARGRRAALRPGRPRSGNVPAAPLHRERTIPQVGVAPCAARSRSACRPERRSKPGAPSRVLADPRDCVFTATGAPSTS